jgi:hypothetical protein
MEFRECQKKVLVGSSRSLPHRFIEKGCVKPPWNKKAVLDPELVNTQMDMRLPVNSGNSHILLEKLAKPMKTLRRQLRSIKLRWRFFSESLLVEGLQRTGPRQTPL